MKSSFLGHEKPKAFRGPPRSPAELRDKIHVSESDHECLNKYRQPCVGGPVYIFFIASSLRQSPRRFRTMIMHSKDDSNLSIGQVIPLVKLKWFKSAIIEFSVRRVKL